MTVHTPGDPAAVRTVADLRAGEVFSVPDTDLGPVLIDGISDPMEGVRQILVTDPYDGMEDPTTHVLGLHRTVYVHDIVAEHQHYTNITGETLTVEGEGWRGPNVAEPGATIHFTAAPRPDLFDAAQWEHKTTPVVTERVERPI